jgi:hypothetical protein
MASSRAGEVDGRLQLRGTDGFSGIGQHAEHFAYPSFRRETDAAEIAPNGFVVLTGDENGVCSFCCPASSPDLLVVGHRGLWRPEMDDEPEIRLVEPHPEGRGRDQRLHAIVEERLFCIETVLLAVPTAVGEDVLAP